MVTQELWVFREPYRIQNVIIGLVEWPEDKNGGRSDWKVGDRARD